MYPPLVRTPAYSCVKDLATHLAEVAPLCSVRRRGVGHGGGRGGIDDVSAGGELLCNPKLRGFGVGSSEETIPTLGVFSDKEQNIPQRDILAITPKTNLELPQPFNVSYNSITPWFTPWPRLL